MTRQGGQGRSIFAEIRAPEIQYRTFRDYWNGVLRLCNLSKNTRLHFRKLTERKFNLDEAIESL